MKKKNFSFYNIIAALAIVGGFTACSNDDDPTEGAVIDTGGKSTISFAVPAGNSGSTRMVDEETIFGYTEFQGIKDIEFWAVEDADGVVTATKDATFTLDITSIDDFTGSGTTEGYVKVYKNITLPASNYKNTHYIFYGTNTYGTPYGKLSFNAQNGKISGTNITTLESVQFSLTNIDAPSLTSNLQTAFEAIIDEMDAKRDSLTAATPSAEGDTAKVILDKMLTRLTVTGGFPASVEGLEVLLNYIMRQYPSYLSHDAVNALCDVYTDSPVRIKSTYATYLGNMPRCVNYITFSESGGDYSAAISNRTRDLGASGNLVASGTAPYAYPPTLWYYGNGRLVASNNGTAASNWSGGTYTGAVANPAVTVDLAYNKSIQFGTGLFTLDIKNIAEVTCIEYDGFSSSVDASLPGYRYKGGGVAASQTPLSGDKFILTGVLIGSQPDHVGFDFTQETATGTITNKVTYDNQLDGASSIGVSKNAYGLSYNYNGIALTNASVADVISTLVLETPEIVAGDDDTEKVYFALELVNNSDETFCGNNFEVVTPGATFYLVGLLNANGVTLPSGVNKVFQQDYTTTANITIGKIFASDANVAYEGAIYATVPDLQVSQHNLAIHVNLEWTAGHTYDVTNFDN